MDNTLYNSNGSYFYDIAGIMLTGGTVGQLGRYFIIAKLIATNDPTATTYVSSGKLLKYVHISDSNEYGWESF